MNMNATLIGQVIWFALFVWFCMKVVWPPIIKALEERRQKIADGLNAAEEAGRDLKLAKERADETLRDTKQQSALLIEQANKRASQIIDEAKQQAVVEGDRIKASARAEIEQEISRAREALRAQVAVLAVAGAERILASTVDAQAHKAMLDQLAAEL